MSADPLPDHSDVLIVGGGLAGLTLARQLRRMRPETQITVVERNPHPVPEAAFKVGESTSELGSFYLRDVLGLADHLRSHQIVKLGLRFFFSAGDNRDIARRVEFGPAQPLPSQTYQLDRGRLENFLATDLRAEGVSFLDGARVRDVAIDPAAGHRIVVEREEGSAGEEVTARWVVDASGRPGFLKRRLGLATDVEHDASAAWFRIGVRVSTDDWSEDEDWQARVPGHRRFLSTNHLMGRGYWVWIIPLASGSTSIGIVADERHHPFSTYSSLEKTLSWLDAREPQLAAQVRQHQDLILDHRVLRHFAHGCRRVFSPDRWCIVGEAGVFSDPFYSPGTDFIAFGNTYASDIIVRDLEGDAAVRERIERHNRTYLATFTDILELFVGQMPLMGNPLVMSTKSLWDFIRYWSAVGMLFAHGKYHDHRFFLEVGSEVWRLNKLDQRMQRFFREWDGFDRRTWEGVAIRYDLIDFVHRMNEELTQSVDDRTLVAMVNANTEFLERFAVEVLRWACRLPDDAAVDPYEFAVPDGVAPREGPGGDLNAEFGKLWAALGTTTAAPV